MRINAVSYARFSSSNQREASIEIQQEHINKYCLDNGITIIKEYVDRALSATSDNRPQFQQMIKDAESGLFSYVVIYSSSRFARNISDHLKYKAILESFGVRIVCVNENFDETTPEGDLMSNFMMSINQYYSRDLGRKTYLGCLETAKECKHVGGIPPFGYYVDSEQKYHINEEEAKAVRFIFDSIEKGLTYKEICAKLKEMGIFTRKGKPFKADFSGMIRNRKYMGEFVWSIRKKNQILNRTTPDCLHEAKDVVRIPDGIPAIVSKEQFLKVNKMLSERRRWDVQYEKRNYLLSSLVRCGNCGYRMSVDRDINGNGKRNWVRMNYRCYSSLKNKNECDTKDFRVDALDTYIKNLLFNVLLNERYSKNIHKLIKEKLGQEYQMSRAKLIENQNEIEKTKQSINNLIGSLAEASNIVYQEVIKEIERLSLRKNDLEEHGKILKDEMDKFPCFNEVMIYNRIKKMKEMIHAKVVEEIKPVVRLLIKEITITNVEVVVKVNLNSYISGKSNRDLDVSIVEESDNIRVITKQLKQNLNWTSLVIRI